MQVSLDLQPARLQSSSQSQSAHAPMHAVAHASSGVVSVFGVVPDAGVLFLN
jgi:hypothetical protein